ncbi:hypothetical protein LCGC14_0181090 [marine sediment metagenome]|uniref:MobA-like NTP transferase domain-containing protein n=1 Tax=marine sediment metagenome TaxID=412755 RepID=A0A0F9X7U8_9ZZZZ|nr:phosphocholine cytidylyltransferase family protein [Phycisphaerae bacterium]HDZ44369.1 phosphocholine cytidylyltransferase family protein [Phycisphaerae bacterium]
MKAVILAAGMGKRLAPAGWTKPKCLLPFGDRTLLGHIVSAATACGIGHVVVVVGYQQQLVRDAMAADDAQVEFVVNDDFSTTNTIHSLYLAREHLDDDFVYFNADVLFDGRIVPMLLDGPGGQLAVDVSRCGPEDVKVVADDLGRITQIGKDLPPETCLGEFIGIGKFARGACADLIVALVRYSEGGRRDLFFESAVNDVLADHVHTAVTIGDLKAVEIDLPEDLDRARRLWGAGDIQTL